MLSAARCERRASCHGNGVRPVAFPSVAVEGVAGNHREGSGASVFGPRAMIGAAVSAAAMKWSEGDQGPLRVAAVSIGLGVGFPPEATFAMWAARAAG